MVGFLQVLPYVRAYCHVVPAASHTRILADSARSDEICLRLPYGKDLALYHYFHRTLQCTTTRPPLRQLQPHNNYQHQDRDCHCPARGELRRRLIIPVLCATFPAWRVLIMALHISYSSAIRARTATCAIVCATYRIQSKHMSRLNGCGEWMGLVCGEERLEKIVAGARMCGCRCLCEEVGASVNSDSPRVSEKTPIKCRANISDAQFVDRLLCNVTVHIGGPPQVGEEKLVPILEKQSGLDPTRSLANQLHTAAA